MRNFYFLAMIFLTHESFACDFNATVMKGGCPTNELNLSSSNSDIDKGLLDINKSWSNFSMFKNLKDKDIQLNVCFTEASEPIAKKIESALKEFSNARMIIDGLPMVSRLRFKLRNSNNSQRICNSKQNSHIRIKFDPQGSNWSRLGTNSLNYLPSMSMSYEPNTKHINKGTILHEFGHALGLRHEMFHPDWRICADAFDAEKYISESGYSFGSNYTKEQQVGFARDNISNVKINIRDHDSTAIDFKSIMTYEISKKFFPGKPKCGMVDNHKLSDKDIEIFLRHYGRVDV